MGINFNIFYNFCLIFLKKIQKVITNGQMVSYIKENEKTIKCMVKAYFFGQMIENI